MSGDIATNTTAASAHELSSKADHIRTRPVVSALQDAGMMPTYAYSITHHYPPLPYQALLPPSPSS